MMIYICTPIATGDRSPEMVEERVSDLRRRLAAKGYDSVSHLDNVVEGKWADRVGGNLALLLSSDGILLDFDRKLSRVCVLEEAVAKVAVKWKRGFLFFHTFEEYNHIKDNFVV